VRWHGAKVGDPDWTGHSRTLAFLLHGVHGQPSYYVQLNADAEAHRFDLPALDGQHRWRRLVDTNLPSPDDIVEERHAVPLNPSDHYIVSPRSSVILVS
jgi:glycogen operon protein